ncbi:helix-turn-helix domain-containing protein [Fulvivirga sediminis]|uniref:Helix-turn-helix domain-containing protein n=1 Tax=Fulvivirga sediminis TaxID=2803949 RepID=A0A937F3V6_9BACT|nr:AraC family transcriptional regulator [Fulvivirga sediminis]MBL3655862.1 helix-turn-helix domain-containing protein [Fulvivirga sediminis]
MSQFLEKVDNDIHAYFVHHDRAEEKLPMHQHTKHQLSYVEGGVAFLNTLEKSYFLPARHFLWIPAGVKHNVTSRTSVKMVHNVYIPTSLFPAEHVLSQNGGIYPVTNLLMEMIYYTEQWNGEIAKQDREQFEFLNVFKNVVLDVAKIPFPLVLPTTDNEGLREVLKYIHLNIDQPLYLNEVAKRFGYSSRSLSRLFKKHMDTSFLQYVKLTRIVRGMEKLLKTDQSISEIAYSCGYNSLSSFSFTFHQVAHMSPAEFRKQNL